LGEVGHGGATDQDKARRESAMCKRWISCPRLGFMRGRPRLVKLTA
jgi:hypothetical protein